MNNDELLTLTLLASSLAGLFLVGIPLDIYILGWGIFCGFIGSVVGVIGGLGIYTIYRKLRGGGGA